MAREFRFPVDIDWHGGRRTTVHVDGKQSLAVATPPEFKGTDPDLWSPEDAFVAAAGSCLAVTIAALAEHDRLPLRALDVHAEGVVGRREDGRFGFVRIEQTRRPRDRRRLRGRGAGAGRQGRGRLSRRGLARPAGRDERRSSHPAAGRVTVSTDDPTPAPISVPNEAGRDPHDRSLSDLVGELSTQSEMFRAR